ncbi:Apl3 protein [Saccharomycopsis crataegensis]|uniref:AP-2 complex subunit alpha n=1 Tax=Saccharomycopsis crataegensis TaxID=43959 RepID=A0AAV5QS11_9ASCO|nr:Apl3 protein [Saccharomycopsis crataegensis]
MRAPMKGLTQFIADLRNSKAQEEEERRINTELVNVQNQFLQPNLNGYQRKKYVCKLIYIYVLGYRISFGLLEAIQLMSSKVYSEKEIGYLALSLFLNEDHEMMMLTINSIKSDLEVDDYEFNCLALKLIAVIGNETFSTILSEPVFQLLRSPTTPPFVKKKASLALLRLIKVNPAILDKYQASWLPRILALMDQEDQNIGFSLSVVSLVTYIARRNPDSVKACIPIIIKKLNNLVIEKDCPEKYVYNGIPDPWLTVKLLNLIEDFILIPNSKSGYSSLSISTIDVQNLSSLRSVVAKAIENGRKPAINQQALNARSAILFSAVSLATRLDPSPEAIDGAIAALSQLLSSKQTNTRYLALNSLVKIAGGSSTSVDHPITVARDNLSKTDYLNIHNSIKNHTQTILQLLKDRDISVRMKSLDTLFLICDFQNVELIVSNLLVYLDVSDYLNRSKISSKIYKLVEKFSKNLTWYVTTTIKIISIAGIYSNPEIWQSFVKVIVNSINNSLKSFACKSLVRHLRADNPNEIMIKIGGFLLGEYCHLLVDSTTTKDSQFSPWNQYVLLYDRYFVGGLQARYIILSAFLKFFKKFPELRTPISKFYRHELTSINTEIQQRSVEYIKLTSRNDGFQLLNTVVDEMPEFPLDNPKEKKSFILNRLEKDGGVTIGYEENLLDVEDAVTTNNILSPTPGTDFSNPFSDSDDDFDFDDNNLLDNQKETEKFSVILSPNWEIGYYKVLRTHNNIFFENSLIQILVKIDTSELKSAKKITMLFVFINKSPADISSFITNVKMMKTVNPPVVLKNVSLPNNAIPKNGRTKLELEANIRDVYDILDLPILEVNFLSGGFTSLKLRIPIPLINSLIATSLSEDHFEMRWKQLVDAGNPLLGKSTAINQNHLSGVFQSFENIRKFLLKTGWGECLTDDTRELKFAGIIHTSNAGNFGTLIKINKNDSGSVQLTVRSTNDQVPGIIHDTLTNILCF